MNKTLMTIVLEAVAFWELAGDDVVDPDEALAQLEGVSSIMDQLTPAEKKELIDFAQEYAEEEETRGGTPERARFFRTVPEVLGLVE